MSEEETITVAALLDGQHHGTTSVVFTHVAGGKNAPFYVKYPVLFPSYPAFISDIKNGIILMEVFGCGKLLKRFSKRRNLSYL
jgi:hypothetical protein